MTIFERRQPARFVIKGAMNFAVVRKEKRRATERAPRRTGSCLLIIPSTDRSTCRERLVPELNCALDDDRGIDHRRRFEPDMGPERLLPLWRALSRSITDARRKSVLLPRLSRHL